GGAMKIPWTSPARADTAPRLRALVGSGLNGLGGATAVGGRPSRERVWDPRHLGGPGKEGAQARDISWGSWRGWPLRPASSDARSGCADRAARVAGDASASLVGVNA